MTKSTGFRTPAPVSLEPPFSADSGPAAHVSLPHLGPLHHLSGGPLLLEALHLLLLLFPLWLPLGAELRPDAVLAAAGQEGALLPLHEGPHPEAPGRDHQGGWDSHRLHLLLSQVGKEGRL